MEFVFDKNDQFVKLKYQYYTEADVDNTEYMNLWNQGFRRASMRVNAYFRTNAQIDNSALCPCGSGKSFEKCCKGRLNQIIGLHE